MDSIAILLLAVLIILVLFLRNSLLERLDRIEREIARLKDREPVNSPAASVTPPTSSSVAPVPPPSHEKPPPRDAPAPRSVPAPRETEPYRPMERPRPQPAPEPIAPAERAASVIIEPPHFQRMDEDPPKQPPSTFVPATPGFFEKHPDLEKFIGENLISKIGIAILVLAIAFFVKYAIDNNWIGAVGRVGIGLLCGGILIGIAHWLRNQYKAFSSVLVGGGLAVFYFTIALAYHQYHLFSQMTAFVIMLVVTVFSVLLAILYDRQELAIIALAGGFLTPFLVSNGRGDYVVLFSYLLILNMGLLVIAYNKLWRLLNILSFGLTALLFASWLLSLPYDAPASTYRGGWEFGTAFYLLFFVINIAYTVRKSRLFVASDFGILLTNTCLYFAAGLYFISQLGLERYKGLYCAVMGIFHLGATWFLFRKKSADKNILYLLVGLTLSFVSLTAPIQLHGHYITLFWASEAVLLYWLFIRSNIELIRIASLLVWGAMLVSLMMDWSKIYGLMESLSPDTSEPIIFNKGLMTGLYAAASCWALHYLRPGTLFTRVSLIAAGMIFYIAGLLEIHFQFNYYYPRVELWVLYVLLFTYLCACAAGFARNAWLMVAGVLFYLASLVKVFEIQQYMLYTGQQGGHFLAHWAGDVIAALILYQLITQDRKKKYILEPEVFTWVICIVVVTFFSAEGQLVVNALFYSSTTGLPELARVYNKTGLPILWGLCSFAFMWLGMRNKFKPLRIVSLALFSLTLLKLFLFDIRNIPIAGKIAAFFCLGVLLLVVSFMYQRLKKIIIEDEEKNPI
jgi:uncharacterized membrane protein